MRDAIKFTVVCVVLGYLWSGCGKAPTELAIIPGIPLPPITAPSPKPQMCECPFGVDVVASSCRVTDNTCACPVGSVQLHNLAVLECHLVTSHWGSY